MGVSVGKTSFLIEDGFLIEFLHDYGPAPYCVCDLGPLPRIRGSTVHSAIRCGIMQPAGRVCHVEACAQLIT